jgi:hypothetical protein
MESDPRFKAKSKKENQPEKLIRPKPKRMSCVFNELVGGRRDRGVFCF